ncbi:phospholipase A [Marinobacter sp. DUT-1]|uniref:phospholipase A n=1 Tax=Marinobacter sp. DUT-1 TaxID=3412037 RepID=UPI003D17A65F
MRHQPWRVNTGLSVCLGVLAAPVAFAQSTGTEPPGDLSAEQCALIENGVRRLACFDRVFKAGKERQAASEDEQEQAEESLSEELPLAGGEGQEESELPEDDDSVMNALLEQYVATEKAIFSFSGSFVGHRPTYILPLTWTDDTNPFPSSPRLGTTGYDYELRKEEAKYQISFKVPLLTGLLEDRTTLWFGYTQQSFWQVYNQDESAPFRETNYEPELFLRYQTNWDLGPGTLNGVTIGFSHQSNGQSEPRSRSWNRIVGRAAYSYGRWLFMVQPWYRIPESSNDDNADIERYLGHANYQVVYKLTEDRTFSLRLMNNLRSDNRTSVEFGYSFPMGETLKGFFQYYNGYGESLIDYNHRIERFGIGIMLNDWL